MKTPKDHPPELKFEQAMDNLQEIVREMESGEMPLENLISRYEEGMKLVKICRDKLAEAEQKIEFLTQNPTPSPTHPSSESNPNPFNPPKSTRLSKTPSALPDLLSDS